MNEFTRNEGHLAAAEQEALRLELLIKGYIRAIRDCLDPLADVADISTDEVKELAVVLADKHIEYRTALAKIQAAKKALGRA